MFAALGRARVARVTARAAALTCVAGLIAAASMLGVQVPASRELSSLPARATPPALAFDGAVAPISSDFTRRELGDEAYLGITGAPEAPVEAAPVDQPTRDEVASPSPPPDRAPPQQIEGEPGVLPVLAPGDWQLTIDMTAPEQVRGGESIDYRMIVANVGTGDFRGRSFRLEWHTPVGTFHRSALGFSTPGLGDAAHEEMNSRGLVSIGPGERWEHGWRVDVPAGAPPGTTYENHAHLHVTVNGEDRTITSRTVVVTVAPSR